MGDNKPVSENTLREEIQDGKDNDLGVYAHFPCVGRSSPDAVIFSSVPSSTYRMNSWKFHSHWIHQKNNQPESSN